MLSGGSLVVLECNAGIHCWNAMLECNAGMQCCNAILECNAAMQCLLAAHEGAMNAHCGPRRSMLVVESQSSKACNTKTQIGARLPLMHTAYSRLIQHELRVFEGAASRFLFKL